MAANRFWKGFGIVTGEMLVAMSIFTWSLAKIVFRIRPAVRRYKDIDLQIFDVLRNYSTPANTTAMRLITVLAKHQFLVPANLCLIYYFLFVRKHTWFSIRIAAIALSSLGLMLVFKQLFQRQRPAVPLLGFAPGLSFPSGHALMSVTFYGLIIYIVLRTVDKPARLRLVISLIVLILLIGFSRVFLRVHYASDVLGGFIIGALWLSISLSILKRIENCNKPQIQLPDERKTALKLR